MKNARYDWVKRTIALLMLVMMLPLQTVYAASVSVTIGEAKAGEKITFSWTKVSGADHYEYSVRELTSNKLIYDHKEAAVTKRSAYIPAKKVHEGARFEIWVGAFKSSGKLLCEDKATCVVAAGVPEKLSSPVVTAPSGGDVLTELSYKFTWKSVSGASRYIFALRDLTTDELLKKQSTTKLYCSISTLEWGHEYRMAVGAVPSGADDSSSDIGWTEVLFSVKELTKLKSPVVTAPSEGDVLTDTTYKFTWKSVSGAERYIFAVRDLTTNTQIVNKSTGNLYYSVSELIKGHEYRMAVGAVPEGEGDSSSYIGWTEVRFSVKGSTKLASPVVTAPSEGAVLTDTSYKIQWKSVSGADHYVFALRDLTTNKLITRKTTDALYYNATLTKGHDYRMAVGAVPAGEADDSVYIGWKEVLFSVKDDIYVNIKADKTSVKVGVGEVTFTITTNAKKVKLFVDGKSYPEDDWKEVTNGQVTYKRKFTSQGSRVVTFRTLSGVESNKLTIKVTAKGKLAKAQITAPETVIVGNAVDVSWAKVKNADQYKVVLYNSAGTTVWTKTTKALNVTIPAAKLKKGTYSITVMATGADYTQSESSVSLTVKAKKALADPKVTIPDRVDEGKDLVVAWTAVKNASYYVVKLFDMNVNDYLKQKDPSPIWKKTIKTGVEATIGKDNLEYKQNYTVVVEAHASGYATGETVKGFFVDKEVTITAKADMTTAKVGKDTVTFTITTNGLKVRTYIDGKAVGDWVIVENGKAIVIYVFPTAGEHKVTFKTLNGTESNEIAITVIEEGETKGSFVVTESQSKALTTLGTELYVNASWSNTLKISELIVKIDGNEYAKTYKVKDMKSSLKKAKVVLGNLKHTGSYKAELYIVTNDGKKTFADTTTINISDIKNEAHKSTIPHLGWTIYFRVGDHFNGNYEADGAQLWVSRSTYQCYGFAKYVMRESGKSYKFVDYDIKASIKDGKLVEHDEATKKKIKEAIVSAGAGAHVRVQKSATSTYGHSFIVTYVDNNGLEVIQANFGGNNNKVTTNSWTWDEFFKQSIGKRGLDFIEKTSN